MSFTVASIGGLHPCISIKLQFIALFDYKDYKDFEIEELSQIIINIGFKCRSYGVQKIGISSILVRNNDRINNVILEK